MLVQIRNLREALRSSLFFIPMFFALGGAALGEAALRVDERVDNVPERLTATVDSARSVLSVVAGATLTFAGTAFSVSLLLISLASSQFSPRVVHGLFRDPFNKRVMGIVVGTFTYCMAVMRAVRGPLEDSGSPVVPSLSTALAVVLGLISVLSIIAFISHAAHSMDVSKILHRVTDEALSMIDSQPLGVEHGDDRGTPTEQGYAVLFDSQGWIQQIDLDGLLDAIEPGALLELDTIPGRYAIPNTPLCRIWPAPSDPAEVCRRVRAAVVVGQTRTMQQDLTYGVRQLADVALKALSPGINDPTTAQDALFHLGSVMRELLARAPFPRVVHGSEDRALRLPEELTHDQLVGLAFDEVRLAAATQPTVQIYLLEILELLTESLKGPDHENARGALARQAELVVASARLATLPRPDIQRVEDAYHHRFG